jgi:hypothetical protein
MPPAPEASRAEGELRRIPTDASKMQERPVVIALFRSGWFFGWFRSHPALLRFFGLKDYSTSDITISHRFRK